MEKGGGIRWWEDTYHFVWYLTPNLHGPALDWHHVRWLHNCHRWILTFGFWYMLQWLLCHVGKFICKSLVLPYNYHVVIYDPLFLFLLYILIDTYAQAWVLLGSLLRILFGYITPFGQVAPVTGSMMYAPIPIPSDSTDWVSMSNAKYLLADFIGRWSISWSLSRLVTVKWYASNIIIVFHWDILITPLLIKSISILLSGCGLVGQG